MWFQVEDLHVILLTLKKCSLWRSISLVSAPYHFLISKISRMFCLPWIASWENLTNVLTLPTTYMYEDLWSVETCDERSLEGPNYYTLPIQKQTTHTTATFYTTADYMVHYASGATKSKLHHSVLQSYSGYESPTYQEPFNNSSPYGRDLAAQTTVYWE